MAASASLAESIRISSPRTKAHRSSVVMSTSRAPPLFQIEKASLSKTNDWQTSQAPPSVSGCGGGSLVVVSYCVTGAEADRG